MPVLVNPSRFGSPPPPPSGITLVSAGTLVARSGVSTDTFDIPYPSGLAAGDIIVMWFSDGGTTISPDPQTGWTTEANIQNSSAPDNLWLGWKVSTGSESGNFTASTNITGTGVAQMLAFRGVDATTPIDVATKTRNSDGAGTSSTPIPSMTTTKTGVCLVYAGAQNSTSNTATPPSSPAAFTETADGIGAAPAGRSGTMGYLIWSGSGATGTVTIGWSGTGRSTGALMALRPA